MSPEAISQNANMSCSKGGLVFVRQFEALLTCRRHPIQYDVAASQIDLGLEAREGKLRELLKWRGAQCVGSDLPKSTEGLKARQNP